jgi:Secretion system C-terminal sorting domain
MINKNGFCLLLLLVVSQLVNAQFWQPVKTGWQYNYRFENETEIGFCLKADSAGVSGVDSIYYLNQLFTPCDTCDTLCITTAGIEPPCYILKNQPGLFGKEMTAFTGGKYYFSDTADFVVFAEAQQGFSWLLDSSLAVNATIDTVYADTIFGIPDSVKIVSLSTGDSLILSMNSGFIQFTDWTRNETWHLDGINGPELGELFPDFWDMFDFSTGDVFQYQIGSGHVDIVNTIINGTEKFTILSRVVSGDSLIYSVLKVGSYITEVGAGTNWTITLSSQMQTETWLFDRSRNSVADALPMSGVCLDSGLAEQLLDYDGCSDSAGNYVLVDMNRDSLGYLTKMAGVGGFLVEFPYIHYRNQSGIHNDLLSAEWSNWFSFGISVKQDLGIYYHGYGCFEYNGERILTAWAVDGDTTGTLTPDSVLLETQEIKTAQSIKVYPNPTENEVWIDAGNEIPESIELFSIQGQQILIDPVLSQRTFLSTEKLPAGSYFLKIQIGETIVMKQIQIVH